VRRTPDQGRGLPLRRARAGGPHPVGHRRPRRGNREIVPEPAEREDRLSRQSVHVRRALRRPSALHRRGPGRSLRPGRGDGGSIRDEGGGRMKSPRDIVIRPIVSEKSYGGLERNSYTFLVDLRASKTEIKEDIQQIWDVRVRGENTSRGKGRVT